MKVRPQCDDKRNLLDNLSGNLLDNFALRVALIPT